jgi:hypothetical protein
MPIVIDDGTDPERWYAAHGKGISASMLSKAMTPSGRRHFVEDYLNPAPLDGSGSARMQVYFEHGRRREEEFIGQWIETKFGIAPNRMLFGADINPRFIATPDGYDPIKREISEFKTSTTVLPKTIKREHRDQMTWQCLVMGTERCLYVHEQHENFVAVDMPTAQWFYPEPERLAELTTTALSLLFEIDMARSRGL